MLQIVEIIVLNGIPEVKKCALLRKANSRRAPLPVRCLTTRGNSLPDKGVLYSIVRLDR